MEEDTSRPTSSVPSGDKSRPTGRPFLVHSIRTALAAVASLAAARLLRLPEAYWAPITTLVITQSSLGAALAVSAQRFMGTALGAVVGAITASQLGVGPAPALRLAVFGGSVFLLGLVCALLRSETSAYRFGGVTLAVVLLVPRTRPPWEVAFSRFAEVSIGIGVALLLAWIWPEKEDK